MGNHRHKSRPSVQVIGAIIAIVLVGSMLLWQGRDILASHDKSAQAFSLEADLALGRAPSGSSGGVEIVSHSSYMNYESWKELFTGETYTGDFFHVVGEVRNTADLGVECKVNVTLYDANSNIVTGHRYWRISANGNLPPGQKRPFLLILLNETASRSVARYDVSATVDEVREYLGYGAGFINHRFRSDTGSVLGEIENTLNKTMEHPFVYATFYDASGNVIGADHSGVMGASRLDQGDRAPFKVILDYRPSAWYDSIEGYALFSSYTESYKVPYTQLEILDHRKEIDEYGWCKVVGQVKNIGGTEADFVQVAVSLWNDEGSIVACDATYTDPSLIGPGETSSFTLGYLTKDQVQSYTLYAYCSSYAKTQSRLSCDINPDTITLGEEASFQGRITPRPELMGEPVREMVTLHFENPLGQEGTRSVRTVADTGGYELGVEPDLTGRWSIWASWRGRDDLTNTTSTPIPFDVESRRDIFPVVVDDKAFRVHILSNSSSINQFSFRESEQNIEYQTYYSSSGWYWFIQEVRSKTRVTIPRDLLEPPFTVSLNQEPLTSALTTNATHSTLLFEHPLRSWGSAVRIKGTVGEFGAVMWSLLLVLSSPAMRSLLATGSRR